MLSFVRWFALLMLVALLAACSTDGEIGTDSAGTDDGAGETPSSSGGDTADSGDSGGDTSPGDGDGDDGSGATTFVERDGFVVMEAETIAIPDGHEWELGADLAGHTGSGYYAFLGNRICNGPAGSPLRYDFTVETDARFELRMRMTKILHCAFGDAREDGHCVSKGSCDRAGAPNEADQCLDEGTCLRDDLSNDVFVHIEDTDGNYVAWKDQPDDTIGDPIKLFVGGAETDAWRWTNTRNLDVSHAKWDAHWDLAPGAYTLVLQGRSQLTRVDRIVLFDQDNHSFSGDDAIERAETR